MAKKCEIVLDYCNSVCPHFYHKYSDFENIWCGKLDRKVLDADEYNMIMFDFKKRPIPDVCPLENAL